VVAGVFATFFPGAVTVENSYCPGGKMDSVSMLSQMLRNYKFQGSTGGVKRADPV
jgi:hypothetical protein